MSSATTWLSCVLLALSLVACSLGSLEVCSFNIEVFGRAKMEKLNVVNTLVKIIGRYDVVTIQEVRDIEQMAIYQLLERVNKANKDDYELVLSERLGRTQMKEQYAIMYRSSKMTALQVHQYDDAKDLFERPPFSVRFHALKENREFGVMTIHAKPGRSVTNYEIDGLVGAYNELSLMWALEDFVVTGDFNAGCSYLGSDDWDWIRLRTQKRFFWAIGDDANTNVNQGSECAYDRIVVTSGSLKQTPGGVFYFDKEYGLSNSKALEVSDHYPVHFTLDFNEQ